MALSVSELYDERAAIYTEGPAASAPPPAGSYSSEGLPPRPSPDRLRDLTLDIGNLEREIEHARQEQGKANLDLTVLHEQQQEREETLEGQGEIAEMNALRAEQRFMGDSFPRDRAERLAALVEKVEAGPDRRRATLEFEASRHGGVVTHREPELAAARQQLAQLNEVEQLHREREVVAAAQRAHWGVETPADLARLSEAKVDIPRLPKRLQPSR